MQHAHTMHTSAWNGHLSRHHCNRQAYGLDVTHLFHIYIYIVFVRNRANLVSGISQESGGLCEPATYDTCHKLLGVIVTYLAQPPTSKTSYTHGVRLFVMHAKAHFCFFSRGPCKEILPELLSVCNAKVPMHGHTSEHSEQSSYITGNNSRSSFCLQLECPKGPCSGRSTLSSFVLPQVAAKTSSI